MVRKLLKDLCPPILWEAVRKLKKPPPPDRLFDGDDALFKSLMKDCRVYGEYGCGASTIWVLEHTGARVLSVDTSRVWLDWVRERIAPAARDRATFHHVDLGPLVEFGRPASYAQRESFPDYTDWMWRQEEQPDLVLVDGRFRVACFLTSLRNAAPGTRLVFDDYVDRQCYHIVETHVSRSEICGRQCLFVVPPEGTLDLDRLDADIAAFRLVTD